MAAERKKKKKKKKRFEPKTEERDRKEAVDDRRGHLECGGGGLMEIGETIDEEEK